MQHNRNTVYKYLNEGKIPEVRIGGLAASLVLQVLVRKPDYSTPGGSSVGPIRSGKRSRRYGRINPYLCSDPLRSSQSAARRANTRKPTAQRIARKATCIFTTPPFGEQDASLLRIIYSPFPSCQQQSSDVRKGADNRVEEPS